MTRNTNLWARFAALTDKTPWEANFYADVSRRMQKYGTTADTLTFGQITAVEKAVARRESPPEARPRVEVPGLVGLFDHAAERLKYPKIRFRNPLDIKFQRAGSQSKHPGCLQVTDGGRYGQNRWYGRVTTDGVFEMSPQCTPEVLAFVREFSADPVGVANAYGRDSGHCCFCDHLLTDEDRSVSLGYGPVCAKNYGLPWGKVGKRQRSAKA